MLNITVKRIFVFTVLLFLLILNSCQPKKKVVSVRNETKLSSARAAETPAPAKKKLVFGTLKKDGTPVEQGKMIISDVDSGNISAAVMTISSSVNGVVEDMVIGELQQVSSLPADEQDLYRRIEDYFADLSTGKKDTKALNPLWSKKIIRVLGNVELNKQYTLRIGSFIHKDDAIDARVRILTPVGRSSGEIFAERENGTWLLSDIAMDFNALKKTYVGNEKKFEPDSFMNVRLEYE